MAGEKAAKSPKVLSDTDAYKQLQELFGSDAVVRPEDVSVVDYIKSRSPGLDRAIGVGGWPRGRVTQLAGKESSGKTFLALLAMAEWQGLDPENCVAFLDAEFTYDPNWAASLGVDNDRVYLVKSNDAAKLFSGLVGKPKLNKKTKQVTIAPGLLSMIKNEQTIVYKNPITEKVLTLKCGKMGVIVLDSVASLQVPSEMASEVGKVNIAPIPRFLNTELKKITPLVADANVVFIGINQVRVDIGKMFGDPTSTPGGKALKHACSLMVEMGPLTGEENQLMDARSEKVGHKVRVKVTKNKLGPPMKQAEFFIDFRSGVTMLGDGLLDLGCLLGVIDRPNNRTYVIGEEKLTSRELAIEYIEANLDAVESKIRDVYMSGKDKGISLITETQQDPIDPFSDDNEDDEYEYIEE